MKVRDLGMTCGNNLSKRCLWCESNGTLSKHALPSSHGLTAYRLSSHCHSILSTLLIEKLTSIFTPSALSPVNCRTLCLILFLYLPIVWSPLREKYQGIARTKLTNPCRTLSFCFLVAAVLAGFILFVFTLNFVAPWPLTQECKEKGNLSHLILEKEELWTGEGDKHNTLRGFVTWGDRYFSYYVRFTFLKGACISDLCK